MIGKRPRRYAMQRDTKALHRWIVEFALDNMYLPSLDEMAAAFGKTKTTIISWLHQAEEERLIVLVDGYWRYIVRGLYFESDIDLQEVE